MRCHAPDPAGGANSAPPDLLVGFRGEERKGKGKEGEREGRDGKKGKENGVEEECRKGDSDKEKGWEWRERNFVQL